MIKLEHISKYEHIRYTFIDGVCYRVCNPFRDAITFLIPISTPEAEYDKDRALIDSGVNIIFPSIIEATEDTNALRDHFSEVVFEDRTGFPEPNTRITSVIGNDKYDGD